MLFKKHIHNFANFQNLQVFHMSEYEDRKPSLFILVSTMAYGHVFSLRKNVVQLGYWPQNQQYIWSCLYGFRHPRVRFN